MAKRRLTKKARAILFILAVAALMVGTVAVVIGVREYTYRFSAAVLRDGNIKIYSGTTFDEAVKMLEKEKFIPSTKNILRFARHHEREMVQAGNYDLTAGSSYRTLLNTLYFGRQTPVRLTFNNIRSMERLAGAVAKYTEADSLDFLKTFRNDSIMQAHELDKRTFISMFIPNTYEVYWTITPSEFVAKMEREYDRFWTSSRRSRAEKLGMSRAEVSTLASIVYEESKIKAEMPTIAGVYLNRIERGIPLQADPTVKFALGDPTIRRILFKHLKIDSPYNTYINRGLPPGPICMPPIVALDAVLEAEEHDYIYFCADSDFSGRHKFASTLSEHNKNAAAYSKALNKARIMK